MKKREISDYQMSVPCGESARGYVPMADDINLAMVANHSVDPLSESAVGKLAEGFHSIAYDTPFAQQAEKIPSDKETLKQLDLLVSATSKLGALHKSDSPSAMRAKRYFNAQRVKDGLGDSVSIYGWLEFSVAMADAAKNARQELSDGELEYNELMLSGMPQASEGQKWSTDLKGNRLPELYYEAYPAGTKGGSQGKDSNTEGPIYTFISLAMELLGYEKPTANSIRKAIEKVGMYVLR